MINFYAYKTLLIVTMALDKKLLAILACPKCKGDLAYKDTKQEHSLTCAKCRLKYSIEDDIPVMLIDKAEKIQ